MMEVKLIGNNMNSYDKCRIETIHHQECVRELTERIANKIIEAGKVHDASKLLPPEVEYFAKYTEKLAGTTYGSEEYNENLKSLKPALDHHYANNRHHPDHFPNGVSGMNLIDIVEMLCDWKCSSVRHTDGNILKSIEINAKRFNISDDLASVLRNTAELLELV